LVHQPRAFTIPSPRAYFFADSISFRACLGAHGQAGHGTGLIMDLTIT
jgi:hypothetical protein